MDWYRLVIVISDCYKPGTILNSLQVLKPFKTSKNKQKKKPDEIVTIIVILIYTLNTEELLPFKHTDAV